MPTWRCLACSALYLTPPDGFGRIPHECALLVDATSGQLVEGPGHRDENWIQDPQTGKVTMRRPGLGRILVDHGDVLTGATAAALLALRTRPALGPVPHPDPPPREAQVWPNMRTNS